MEDFEAVYSQWRDLRGKFRSSECKDIDGYAVYELARVETQLRRHHWAHLSLSERYELDARRFFVEFAPLKSVSVASSMCTDNVDRIAERLGEAIGKILPTVVRREVEIVYRDSPETADESVYQKSEEGIS